MNRGSGPKRPGSESGEHDRTVVPALASLVPLTAPTTDERARIRERVLAGLADTAEAGTAHPVAPPDSTAETEPAAAATTAEATTTVATDTVAIPTDRVRPKRHRAASGRVARASRGPRGRRGTTRGGGRDDPPARPMSGARGRFAVAAVAVLALVGSLAGMSLLLARDALPGDALYGFKRTAEAASLGLTFGDESKALKHLDFASARISEIETLTRQYPAQDGAPVGSYLTALTDFDNDAAAGSRQLIALATRADGSQLELLRTWALQQDARLTDVTLPSAVRGRETATLDLLDKIAGRAATLLDRMDCYQITSGSFDDVGALPARGACERVTGMGPGPDAPGSSVPPGTDSSARTAPPPSGAEPEPGRPTPPLPPLPGVASVLPGTSTDGSRTDTRAPDDEEEPTVVLPLPLPTVELPPLLPGLPGVRIG